MIELAKVIDQFRNEIKRAQATSVGESLLFEIGPIELELTLKIATEGKGDGKVRFYVFEMGAGGSRSSEDTQRVKFTLNPVMEMPPQSRRVGMLGAIKSRLADVPAGVKRYGKVRTM